ncbi:CFEM domain-containing protein [Aspergillus tanneri]|uniref:Extracellular membrane protein CFEM domain-containing protein n=1 Tax=Aspergillus tanneri TaxID=1220188 RepID=A0A5M9MPB6_9EURO|nr:uncharacterized protein ATNIH1004_007787 [Aspergillus tanneri]KAA8646359.1 hypothetical protein ATNIH1004_007787 [Aspergillus tanneri]
MAQVVTMTDQIILLDRRNMLLFYPQVLFIAVSLVLTNSANGLQHTAAVASPTDSVPKCAANCVANFIQTEYPDNACSRGFDTSCLCRIYAKSGYTLGEAALRCSLSFCSLGAVLSSTAYSICDSVAGALPRTHPTITATVVAMMPTQTTAENTVTPSSISSSSSSPLHSQTTHTSRTSTLFTTESPISISSTEQHSSRITSDQPPSPSATSKESKLNAGAVIGVSVASGVSGFFIVGVIIFFCCRKIRRRNQLAKGRNFFEIGGSMSEPSDFALPSRRPTPGPNSLSGVVNQNLGTSRLRSPFEYRPQNPAVVVTRPGSDYNNGPARGVSPRKIGFAFSSNSDLEASPSQSSPRTLSDLLPEKPTYDLYPQPLRWSQHKPSRPTSGETVFEEDVTRPRGGPGALTLYMNPSSSPARHGSTRQYNRIPMTGLPDNPRAMFHGFQGKHNRTLVPRSPDPRKKLVYANAGARIQPPHHNDICGHQLYQRQQGLSMYHDNSVDNYWRNLDHGYMRGVGMRQPHSMARRSFNGPEANSSALDILGGEFETINIHENSGGPPNVPSLREFQTPYSRKGSANTVECTPATGVL